MSWTTFSPNSISKIRKGWLMKFSNSIFWNDLDYENMKYKFLLFIVFVEVSVDILMRHSLSWRKRIVFLGIFEVFLSQCWHNWPKNLEFGEHLKKRIEKVTFCISSIYQKKFKNNSVNVRSSRTGYLHYLRTFWKIFLQKIILS